MIKHYNIAKNDWCGRQRRENRWHIVVALSFFSRNQSAESAAWPGFYIGFQLWFTEICECLLYTNDRASASLYGFVNTYAGYVYTVSFRLALIVYTFTKKCKRDSPTWNTHWLNICEWFEDRHAATFMAYTVYGIFWCRDIFALLAQMDIVLCSISPLINQTYS